MIFAAASPVFEAMFYGKFDITNSILITDITYNSFQLFVEYLYTGNLKLNESEEIESLLELACCGQKYIINDLRMKCVSRLREVLNRENVFTVFSKAFEYHLEDFLMACLYFFVDAMESSVSLCNVIINRNSNELSSPGCFEFLAKNLLDYLGDRQEVLTLIKAWSLHQTKKTSLDEEVVTKLNLDSLLTDKLIQMKAAFFDASSKVPKSFHRIYYKPVRPFIIERGQNYYDVNISFKKFVIVNHFTLNSRLIPEQYDFCDVNNQSYVEKIEVNIFEKSSNQIVFSSDNVIDNVSFNASFKVKISDRMILFPHHTYVVRFKWNDDQAGFEYPRAIFSLVEKSDRCNKNQQSGVVQFHENNINFPFGSIVQGVFYEIVD